MPAARSPLRAAPATLLPSRGLSSVDCLRIDPGSLGLFAKYISLLPGKKLEQLSTALSVSTNRTLGVENFDRVATLTPAGKRQVFDLTEPMTSSFIANGLVVHNCSEYMFLDNTACNLASLNVLTFFDADVSIRGKPPMDIRQIHDFQHDRPEPDRAFVSLDINDIVSASKNVITYSEARLHAALSRNIYSEQLWTTNRSRMNWSSAR